MNKTNNNFDILIIGGGCAGIFAATTGSYFGYKCCIIERNDFLGGQVTQLYANKKVHDFPTKINANAKSIVDELVTQVKETDSKIMLNMKILEINNKENLFYIRTENNKETITGKFLIIATGIGALIPNRLEINNEEIISDKIIYSIDENIEKFRNKKIIILGGGDSAIDWSNHLVNEKISYDVSIIHRRKEFRGNLANVDKMTKNNIKQYTECELINVDNNYLYISDVNKNNIEISYDFILVQYGQKNVPFTIDFFENIEKTSINKIIVNQNQQTNLPNVYAVGDATFYKNKANTIVTAVAESTKVIWDIYKENKKYI